MCNKFLTTIIAVAATMSIFCSCSDDDMNTAEATVSMGEATYSVKENRGLFTIPVVVSGEQNGDIKVAVDVRSVSSNCMVDKHFMVTSTEVVIPSSKKSVNIEIKTVDDREINEDRQFEVSISSVQGASIGTNKNTLITLIDNDDIPYDRMDGIWTVTATNMLTDDTTPATWETRLSTVVDETEAGYGSIITMSPWTIWDGESYDFISHTMLFNYSASSQTATVTFKLGEKMCEGIILGGEDEGGFNLTSCFMRSAAPTQTGYTTSGSVIGQVNSDFTQITFNLPLMGLIYDANSMPFSYWFYYSDIVMTKK